MENDVEYFPGQQNKLHGRCANEKTEHIIESEVSTEANISARRLSIVPCGSDEFSLFFLHVQDRESRIRNF